MQIQELGVERIVIKKDREQQYDQKINTQWKNARINFFMNLLPNELKKLSVDDDTYQQIVQQFLKIQTIQKGKQSSASSLKKKYEKQLSSLRQLLQSIQTQYAKRQRKLILFELIMKKEITSLKFLHIQYSKKIKINKYEYRYSISTFEFLKVVHQNKLLSQATLEGVQLQYFRQFIRTKNNLDMNGLAEPQKEEQIWMKEFNPSTKLKLSIDTIVQFNLREEKAVSYFYDLMHFVDLFYCVSNMSVKIRLGFWNKIIEWESIFLKIMSGIKIIKKLNLSILGISLLKCIPLQSVSFLRSNLFGELSSFTDISQISFEYMKFSPSVGINDFLTMVQNLRVFCENNNIIHLSLSNCGNFPNFPKITTLKSIDFENLSFRNQNFVKDILKTIQKQILQNVQIVNWNGQLMTIFSISSKLSSFITAIRFYQKQVRFLHQILHVSTYRIQILRKISNSFNFSLDIYLSSIPLVHKLICLIPSPYLENIFIWTNSEITDKGLQQIDLKWPLLKYLTICHCSKVTENVWSLCKFKGLIELTVTGQMLRNGNKCFNKLRSKGVKIIKY